MCARLVYWCSLSVYVDVDGSRSHLLLSPGIANEQKKLYGTQFHPEVDLTERGMEMLRTFLFEIAGCTSNFTVQNRQQTCISEIREKVGKSKVLVRADVFIYLNYLFSAHYEASLRDNLKKKKRPGCRA